MGFSLLFGAARVDGGDQLRARPFRERPAIRDKSRRMIRA